MRGGRGRDRMVILPMLSAPFTTNAVPLRRGVLDTTLCDKVRQ